MITHLFDRLFILYWGCWILIRTTRNFDVPIPYLNDWLTDLVFVPIIIHVSFCVGNEFIISSKPVRYPLPVILLISLLVSLVYELILPQITDTSRADYLDIIAYFIGGFFYYFVHQRVAVFRRMSLKKLQGTTG